jgi:hypothetical protein
VIRLSWILVGLWLAVLILGAASLSTAAGGILGALLVLLGSWSFKGTVRASALPEDAHEMAILDGFIKAGEACLPSWQDTEHPLYDPSHPYFVATPDPRRAEKRRPDPTTTDDMRRPVRQRRIDALERIASEMMDLSNMLVSDDGRLFSRTTRDHLRDRFNTLKDKFDRLMPLVHDTSVEAWDEAARGPQSPGKVMALTQDEVVKIRSMMSYPKEDT